MSDEPPLKVVLCWHMHQPHYQDLIQGDYQLPWTYLHAIKDYVDMAAHLEAVPQARAVVNFAPTLIEQIEDYAAQVKGFLEDAKPIRDPLLATLDHPALPASAEHRVWLLKSCLRANEQRLIGRFPAYRKLADMARAFMEEPDSMMYLSEQFLVDLVVWYHLAWLGETVRRGEPRIKGLLEKGSGYTLHDRRQLLRVVGELLAGVIGRYRALAEAGRVELAVSPYAHPILPLMLDLGSAREATPDARMPVSQAYPGGAQRARWHLDKGIETFERAFGFRPRGCWPSEGSLSTATLELLDEAGFQWTASGETVLRNSLEKSGYDENWQTDQPLYRPYRLETASGPVCFFRDDGLSDLIGFTYADWHADDAVGNLVHHLRTIAAARPRDRERVVSIILDGENAWEYYPENGYYFLSALYEALAENEHLELTTFSACVDAAVPARPLGDMVAGSWVYGTFSTWIGDDGKNRGWDMLVDAKHAYDEQRPGLKGEKRAMAEQQLALCEGSDWFWWFGDYNPAETVNDFEHLYRLHLSNLYQLLGREPPEYLSVRFTHGHGAPAMGGVMRRGKDNP